MQKSKKSFEFHILNRAGGFLMVPTTAHYDEYIDRPKFTEQKKCNWACSSSRR